MEAKIIIEIYRSDKNYMDLYLKTLSISNNTTMEDIAYPCTKLLDWLYKRSFFFNERLSRKDATNLGKAVVYLNTCYQMHGDDLIKYILEEYSFYEDCIRAYFPNNSRPLWSTLGIFQHLAKINDAAPLLCCLESVTASISSNYTLLQLPEDDNGEISDGKLIMIDFLQSLLQVPSDQINVVIKRAFNYMPFNIIGLVFCEPLFSYYDICLIVADKICQQISSISISKSFIRSLYHSICISNSGRKFFWLCLTNLQFADAIQTFIVIALSEIFEAQPNACECFELLIYKEHKVNHVLYLAWTSLAPKSPCHNNLYNSILETRMSKSILNVINNFESIYE